eukprot:gb/GECG01001751.1/.p2 GENE.gb/GECG01001751.1/~~gb/GECG01001751.1/.p2  ORF type:complete len:210 (+),score=16.12 gb/GECG01001751.1/:131-760(+)
MDNSGIVHGQAQVVCTEKVMSARLLMAAALVMLVNSWTKHLIGPGPANLALQAKCLARVVPVAANASQGKHQYSIRRNAQSAPLVNSRLGKRSAVFAQAERPAERDGILAESAHEESVNGGTHAIAVDVGSPVSIRGSIVHLVIPGDFRETGELLLVGLPHRVATLGLGENARYRVHRDALAPREDWTEKRIAHAALLEDSVATRVTHL